MKNINESGRSMVEMLGVLAIIGVLSVGGIAGYTRAMKNWRANEIIDAANKVVVLAETSDTSSEESYANIGTVGNIAGGAVTSIAAQRTSSGGTVTITLKDNSAAMQALATAISDKLGTANPSARVLSGYTRTINCGTDTACGNNQQANGGSS